MTAVSRLPRVTTLPAYETVLQLLKNLLKHQTETYLLSKRNSRPSRERGSWEKVTRPLSGDTTQSKNGLKAHFFHPRCAKELLHNSCTKGRPPMILSGQYSDLAIIGDCTLTGARESVSCVQVLSWNMTNGVVKAHETNSEAKDTRWQAV